MIVEYIYRIEVNCFKDDEKYEWNVLCREKANCKDEWKICAIGFENTPEYAFNKALYYVRNNLNKKLIIE